ncbi:MAG: hypothetical protein WAL91_04285 [Propionicimonas sp.]
MTARRIAVVALAWLATVALVSALTWTVISTAGLRPARPAEPTAFDPSASAPTVPAGNGWRSWRGTAGWVTASCTGTQISLGTAVPAVGYAVEVAERGPRRLRLEFERSDSESGQVKLEATCVDGVPHFSEE